MYDKLELMRKKLNMDGAFDGFRKENADIEVVQQQEETSLSQKAIVDATEFFSPTIYGFQLWSEKYGGALTQFMDLNEIDDAGLRNDIQRLAKKMDRKQLLKFLGIAYEMVIVPTLQKKDLLQIKPIDHILTIDEADELGSYFTKRELVALVDSKGVKNTDSMKIIELLIKISEFGCVPVQPDRFIKCKRCSNLIKFSQIKIIPFLELEQRGQYCESCDEYIKKLNKTTTQGGL